MRKLIHPIDDRVSDQGLHCNTLGSPGSCTLEALVPKAFLNKLAINLPGSQRNQLALVQNRFCTQTNFYKPGLPPSSKV